MQQDTLTRKRMLPLYTRAQLASTSPQLEANTRVLPTNKSACSTYVVYMITAIVHVLRMMTDCICIIYTHRKALYMTIVCTSQIR